MDRLWPVASNNGEAGERINAASLGRVRGMIPPERLQQFAVDMSKVSDEREKFAKVDLGKAFMKQVILLDALQHAGILKPPGEPDGGGAKVETRSRDTARGATGADQPAKGDSFNIPATGQIDLARLMRETPAADQMALLQEVLRSRPQVPYGQLDATDSS
jgi:hypothetical protein